MVGDNYLTDIQAAIQFGMDSLMVLTGYSTRQDLQGQVAPTYLLENLDQWRLP